MIYRGLVAALAVLGLISHSGLASANAVEDFYKGKSIRIIVAGGPGASLGLYARVLAEHIGRHIPGNPTLVPDFRGGAGGTIAASFMANAAPKDGSHIGLILPPTVFAPLLTAQKYDASKFQWLGSMTPRPAVVSVWSDAPATTLDGARRTELIVGSTGKTSETFLIPQFMNSVLGTKFKIVTGYKAGDEVNLAMERREVHGRMQYWSGWTTIKETWLKDGKLAHLVQYGPPIREIPLVPQLRDLVTSDEHKQMVDFLEVSQFIGQGFYLPDGVPADRVQAMRQAFAAMMRDPMMIEDAKKRGMDLEHVTGEELQRLVAKALALSPAMVEKVKIVLDQRG